MKKIPNQEQLTTESVSAGHPDKIADQIAEAVLDFCLQRDSEARVACEVFVTSEKIHIGGEIKSKFEINDDVKAQIRRIVWKIIKEDIGYTEVSWKNLAKLQIAFFFTHQAKEIDKLVSKKHVGAGDNSTVFGYASNDNATYFPPFQQLANQILQEIQTIRQTNNNLQKELLLAPDGKIQIFYEEDKLHKIVLCQQFLHKSILQKQELIKKKIKKKIIDKIVTKMNQNKQFEFQIIPFIQGGPKSDSGLTGRKIMIDTYGTLIQHGGGSFAGKDPSKTDKTLALFARFIAKHIVALGLSQEITIQISSTIGISDLQNITCIQLSEDGKENKKMISKIIARFFSWDIEEIVEKFALKNQKYYPLSSYGYFGREGLDVQTKWEELSLLKKIRTWRKNLN